MTYSGTYSNACLEEELLQPYTHILQVRGKLLRKKICLAFNHWLKVPKDKLYDVVDLSNMIHNASLLIDDVQDNSQFRRTIPAAHCVFGIPLTINTSLHVLHLALERFLDLHPQASKVYVEEMINTIRGQGIDIYWRDNHICPNEADYKRMAEQKTGGMCNLSVRTIQLFSENKTDFTKLVLLLGVYFQIRDDYCNLNKQEALEDWPGDGENVATLKEEQLCEDLTEGKFSLPIIHALQFPGGAPIMRYIETTSSRQKHEEILLNVTGKAWKYAIYQRYSDGLHLEAEAEVARLGGNPDMDEVLAELLTWQNN